jgi:hypothetical protein
MGEISKSKKAEVLGWGPENKMGYGKNHTQKSKQDS